MDAALGVWADSPAVTRILLITYPLTWLLLQTEIFSEFIATLFYFTPAAFLQDFWFWTIATSTFVQFPSHSFWEDILILVLVTVVFAQMLPQQEKAMGSTLMIWRLISVGIAIRLVFLALTFVLGKVLVLLGAVEDTNVIGLGHIRNCRAAGCCRCLLHSSRSSLLPRWTATQASSATLISRTSSTL